jgi:hypothetical protein
MIQKDPEPLTKRDRALVECLRILARRGRELREAAAKQAAEQARYPVENDANTVMNVLYIKENGTEGNSPKDAHKPGDQQSQVSIVPDEYDI